MLTKFPILFLGFLLSVHTLFGQCSSTISSFPYSQNFESNTGAWVSGGTNNDWAWGAPSKAFITSAGGGNKCWVTGGLSGSFYNNGERGYVVSPCFDFTNLPHPYFTCKVYWECENTYDGTTFQYTINNGLTWHNVGAVNEPVNCMNEHWFNAGSIINLNSMASPSAGWAGTALPTSGSCQGGGGSNGWVTAKHCLTNLGGQTSVQFRFVFGAGTTCNAFDGFAFDDVTISEAPAVNGDFTYACTSQPDSYQFTLNASPCPDNFSWNFGDPASGTANTSTVANPMHTFSSPGTYTVSVSVGGPCNPSTTITHVVSMLQLVSTVVSEPSCAGKTDGTIQVNAVNGVGPMQYSLQPGNVQQSSSTFTQLGGGQYTLSVVDSKVCQSSLQTVLNNPSPMQWTEFVSKDISCFGMHDGQLNSMVSSAHGGLQFSLQPTGTSQGNGNFMMLNAGTYTVQVMDDHDCSLSRLFTIAEPDPLQLKFIHSTPITCSKGEDGKIDINYTGGTGNRFYTLFPGSIQNTTGSFSGLNAGSYTIICTDQNACSQTATANIASQEGPCCNQVFVPNAFSPNGDGKNDEFFLRNALDIELIDFKVYNRWGEAVFIAQNINDFWNGHYMGHDAEVGTYYYLLRYRCNSSGKEYDLKGDVTLLR